MRRVIVFATMLVVTCVMAVGCVGLVIAPLRGISNISVAEQLKINEPLQVPREQVTNISSLAIGYPAQRMPVFEDRFREFQLQVIYSELENKKRFRLIPFTKFKSVSAETMIKLRAGFFMESLNDQQRKEVIQKIGKELDTDAILLVKEKSLKHNMAKSLITAGVVGTIDTSTILSFEVVSSQTGETIWKQEQELVYTAGKAFIDLMADDEIIEIIKPTIVPLIDDLIASFR